MARLDGKVAIVTGGTSGIGKRTAERFAEEGAKVIIAARREAEGQAIAEAIGGDARFIRTDVSREDDVEALIAKTIAAYGRLDVLFNNAGCPAPTGGIEGISLEASEQAMSVLFGGVLLGMKHAAPVMKKHGAGSIINNGSIAGHQAGWSSSVIYAAAKSAVIHLSRCVAMELGEVGVRVNSISPGAIATGIFGKAMGLETEAAEQTAKLMEGAFAQAQPIQRAGLPDDIANAAVFLASDESSFINGADILVDGGMIGGRHWSAAQEGYKAMRQVFGIAVEG
ncbi:MAG TPA: SDR family oxidoreductase [Alphaproteobacteria bacterium]|nr:SDR family oxidoreductase [Alphaproteobacteria bacterium]